MSVQMQRNKEDTMYTCSCCGSVQSREEYPPIAGMCPECHKSKEKALIALYNDVERVLSHALQPELTANDVIAHVTRSRDDLRKIMQKMGWKGPF